MIKLEYLIRRAPGLELADFQRHWKTVHGPQVAGAIGALGCFRYVQAHTVSDPAIDRSREFRGGMDAPHDGVEEYWWRSEEDLEQSLASAEGIKALEALVSAERTFIDVANSVPWFGHEFPQLEPAGSQVVATPGNTLIKVQYPIRGLPELSATEYANYCTTRHGPLIRGQAEAMGLLRYIQVHRHPCAAEDHHRRLRGTEVEPYSSLTEVWVDRGRPAQGPDARAAGFRAIEDERRFIDFPRSSTWAAKEAFSVVSH